MSDDLVKRANLTLDDLQGRIDASKLLVFSECIDRIEGLEAKLTTSEKYRDAYAECDRIGTQAVRELEAKLAKAVAFIEIVERCGNAALWDLARITLAELTGGQKDGNV